MDIEKEREAFEVWLFREYPDAIDFIIIYRPDENTYEHHPTQARWEAWQAAKAQALPEGFVVLAIDDMERICRCLDDHAVYITYKASDALESIQKAMIEAQQPSSTSDCPDEP